MKNDVTISKMAQRPRLTVDVDPEFLAQLRIVAAKRRISIRQAVIQALAKEYSEVRELADKELGRD